MNRRRMLMASYALFGVLIVFFIVYLFNSSYEQPPETSEAYLRELVANVAQQPDQPENGGPDPVAAAPDSEWVAELSDAMEPVYTPTPTPTPTPAPTPKRFTLAEMTYGWRIVSIAPNSVTVYDDRTKQEFDLTMGGEAFTAEMQGQQMEIRLCGVNIEATPPTADFCAAGEKITKEF